MTKTLERLVSSAKSIGEKLLITAVTIPFFFGVYATNAAEPDDQISSSYKFHTQGRNVTGVNNQLPAQKGLSIKHEDPEIKQTGNYQEETRPPRIHQEIGVQVKIKGNDLKITTKNTPQRQNLNIRIPLQQQVYHEDPNNTHVYLIIPKNLTLEKEIQVLHYMDKKGKTDSLLACPPEDTKLSGILTRFNAGMEGTISPSRKVSNRELEDIFDNVANIVPGKTGKGIKYMKELIVLGLEKSEEKRVNSLREKYGKEYLIHKIPTLVPQGINLAYCYLGRSTVIKINTSGLDSPQKIFIEIPQITFEQEVPGATRKASLEGLVFEVGIEPPKGARLMKDIYGEWVELGQKETSLRMGPDGVIMIRQGRETNIGKADPVSEHPRVYLVEKGTEDIASGITMSPSTLIQNKKDTMTIFKRKGAPEKDIENLGGINGRWTPTEDFEHFEYLKTIEILENNIVLRGEGKLERRRVLKKTEIEGVYILKTERTDKKKLERTDNIIISIDRNGKRDILTNKSLGTYTKEQ